MKTKVSSRLCKGLVRYCSNYLRNGNARYVHEDLKERWLEKFRSNGIESPEVSIKEIEKHVNKLIYVSMFAGGRSLFSEFLLSVIKVKSEYLKIGQN